MDNRCTQQVDWYWVSMPPCGEDKGWLYFLSKKKRKKKNLNCLCTKLVTWTFAQLKTCCDVMDVLTHINVRCGLNAGPGNFCWNLWVKDHFTHSYFFFLWMWPFLSSTPSAAVIFSSSGMHSLHWKNKTQGRAISLPGGMCRTEWVCVYINIYIIYINIYNTDFKKSNPYNIHFFLICAKNVFSEKILFSYSDFVLSLICKCASFKHYFPLSLVSQHVEVLYTCTKTLTLLLLLALSPCLP